MLPSARSGPPHYRRSISGHRWMLRHVYGPLVKSGYSRTQASVVVFVVSAAMHEVASPCSCPGSLRRGGGLLHARIVTLLARISPPPPPSGRREPKDCPEIPAVWWHAMVAQHPPCVT